MSNPSTRYQQQDIINKLAIITYKLQQEKKRKKKERKKESNIKKERKKKEREEKKIVETLNLTFETVKF